MSCYCANYYGSIGCRNTVSRFGDRCKLCVALKSGASMSNGLLSDDHDLWMAPEPRHQRPAAPGRQESGSWRSAGGGSSSGGSGRSGGGRK